MNELLLQHFLDPTLSVFDIADRTGLCLDEILDWMDSPDAHAILDNLRAVADYQSALILATARPRAIQTLAIIAAQEPTTPAHTETIRKAASQLARIAGAAPEIPNGPDDPYDNDPNDPYDNDPDDTSSPNEPVARDDPNHDNAPTFRPPLPPPAGEGWGEGSLSTPSPTLGPAHRAASVPARNLPRCRAQIAKGCRGQSAPQRSDGPATRQPPPAHPARRSQISNRRRGQSEAMAPRSRNPAPPPTAPRLLHLPTSAPSGPAFRRAQPFSGPSHPRLTHPPRPCTIPSD